MRAVVTWQAITAQVSDNTKLSDILMFYILKCFYFTFTSVCVLK